MTTYVRDKKERASWNSMPNFSNVDPSNFFRVIVFAVIVANTVFFLKQNSYSISLTKSLY